MSDLGRAAWMRKGVARGFTALAAVLASACAVSGPSSEGPGVGLKCVDDSPHCISQREKVFDRYMADTSRSWVKQPAGAEAHASGVRLFAFSKRRKDLSCDELRHGKREADSAPGVLRGSGSANLTPAQISRGVMLANEVSRELAKEISRRCG